MKNNLWNINWSYGQKQNVVNNVDMSSIRAPWKNGPYKNKHTGQHKTHRTQRRNIHSENNYLFFIFGCFYFDFFIDDFLNNLSRKCWVTALVRSMTFIGGLNQFESISHLTLSQHCLEKKPGYKTQMRCLIHEVT